MRGVAYVGLANLDRVSIVSTSDHILQRMPQTRGKARIFKVFRFLQEAEPAGVTDLESALKSFVAQNKRRGLAVLISDLYDPRGFERGLNVLRYNKFDPFVVHVVDPADAKPKLHGDVLLYDCETGDEREVTVTAKVLERFGEAHRAHLAEIDQLSARLTRSGVHRGRRERPLRRELDPTAPSGARRSSSGKGRMRFSEHFTRAPHPVPSPMKERGVVRSSSPSLPSPRASRERGWGGEDAA